MVLDDDPTGAQLEADVPITIDWSRARLERIASRNPRAVHVLTNARALDPKTAYETTRAATTACLDAVPSCRILLRGDSTLRAHLLMEYQAVKDAGYGGINPVHLLVPALPSAGRVTIDGVHYIERDGAHIPLHETEYGRAKGFVYSTSDLVQWAEARSRGYFHADDGVSNTLAETRADGPEAISVMLKDAAAAGRPAICAPSAATIEDLEIVAEGLRLAEADEVGTIVRSAPAFVGVLAKTLADGFVPLPTQSGGVVVISGSYVDTTRAQLRALEGPYGDCMVEVDVERLLGSEASEAIDEAIAKTHESLLHQGVGVVATSAAYAAEGDGFRDGILIARRLAGVLSGLPERPNCVVSKGGITSAVNMEVGLGASEGRVIGPLVTPGVSLWQHTINDGDSINHVVFPGNVGGPADLLRVVEALIES